MGFRYYEGGGGSTDLERSEKLEASHITDLGTSIRRFVNQGIGSDETREPAPYDLDVRNTYNSTGWVDSEKIFKPEFYGSPDPRMNAVSGCTHFRETNSDLSNNAVFSNQITGTTYTPVPGLCSRIKLAYDAMVYINASFYAYEIGGIAQAASRAIMSHSSEVTETLTAGNLGSIAARFALSINGNRQAGTTRELHISTLTPDAACFGDLDSWPFNNDFDIGFRGPTEGDKTNDHQLNDGQLFYNMIARQQFSMVFAAQLQRGIYDIGVVCRPIEQLYDRDFQARFSFGSDDSYDNMRAYGVEHGDWPTFPKVKHIFVGSRNFVLDAYYTGPTSYSGY
tara:strand:+ start:623 stop:1636 length:1014 start_codon:yes stop_codon:yes gene_type:complete